MHSLRRFRLLKILGGLTILLVVAGLILYALRQNLNLFFTPSQVSTEVINKKQFIRLGGMVVKNSTIHPDGGVKVLFKISDFKQTVIVEYNKSLPSLFREGQGVVALGRFEDALHFKADDILAKHDENYMPPDLKSSLTKVRV